MSQSPTDIFISEYIEGSANNKALEFYNGTGAAIDLTAGNYVVQYYFNGSATPGLTISLAGSVPNSGTFILAQSAATFLVANGGATTANQTNSGSWYNGDDAVVLRKGGATGTIVDVIGQIGFDPGTEWGTGLTSTADNTLRRKATDCFGDTNGADVFDPALRFDGFATDDFSGLGSHSSVCSNTSPVVVTKQSLQFSTTVGATSAEQSYTVKGNGLSADVTVSVPAGTDFRISLSPGGPYASQLTIPFATANGSPVNVYVVFSPASTSTQTGTLLNFSNTDTAKIALTGIVQSANNVTPIFNIQGTGASSTFAGTVVTTEGVVTADFQGSTQLKGYYLQDTTGDGNTLTSDGIFVFDTSFNVNVGDYVRITGTVDEFFNLTELKTLTARTTLLTARPLPAPIDIVLPVPAVDSLEKYEGMYVHFPQTLTASETFTLGRFGEVLLSANGRLINPTNVVDPNDNPASGLTSSGTSNVAAVTAFENVNLRSQILLDDASNVQNPPIVPFLNPADTTLRLGSTVTSLTGILDYEFSTYRLQPTIAPAFNYAPRPAVPTVGLANLKVASFNVLNYFNGNGTGGGFPTSRGADSLSEFIRQRTKIIRAIASMNADVVGLIEIENDGNGSTSAIADIVNGLNTELGAGTYTFVPDPVSPNGNTGTDEIKVAMIYKPSKLTTFGPSRADISPVHNRPPLAQTFTVNSNGEKFSMIVNHFKSKGCSGSSGADVDQLDGQSCFNFTRKQQAQALLSFIGQIQTAAGDSDVVSVGDYNAYEEEDPIDILKSGGLINLITGSYSFVFNGEAGSLDHAFVTPSFLAQVTGAAKWHVNADEPLVKSYDQQFNPPYVYSPDAYRSSDHDPLLVGLQAGNVPPTISITSPANNASFPAGSSITVTANASDADGSVRKVEFYNAGVLLATDSVAPYTVTGANIEAGSYVVTAIATDNKGATRVSDTVRITVTACTGSGAITAEGYTNIPGTQVTDLLASPSYPNSPSIGAQLNTFEYSNVGDNYGGRLRGYICAPQTGAYTFFIAGDDQAGLFLSTDENPNNKSLIAYTLTPVGFRAWTTYTSQRSAQINLVKGARYYIETLQKQSSGANHLSVGWILPDGTAEGPIPGNRLSPIISTPAPSVPDFAKAMKDQQIKSVTGLTVTVSPNPTVDQFVVNVRSSNLNAVDLRVLDANGRVVEERRGQAANGQYKVGARLSAGFYLLELRQGNTITRCKLVKH